MWNVAIGLIWAAVVIVFIVLWQRQYARRREAEAEAEALAWQSKIVAHECPGCDRIVFPPEGVYVRGNTPYLAVKLPQSYRVDAAVFSMTTLRDDSGAIVITLRPRSSPDLERMIG